MFTVAFEICDLNRDGRVYKSDVLEVVTAASEIFSEEGKEYFYHFYLVGVPPFSPSFFCVCLITNFPPQSPFLF
jgi:hypothetical protein